jgi:hypothetical protein
MSVIERESECVYGLRTSCVMHAVREVGKHWFSGHSANKTASSGYSTRTICSSYFTTAQRLQD